MNSGTKGAENFLSIKIGQIFFANYMANDDFSEPPRRADSKSPVFIFFCQFSVWVTSEARGVSLGRILGVLSIEPFWGGGGLAKGLY